MKKIIKTCWDSGSVRVRIRGTNFSILVGWGNALPSEIHPFFGTWPSKLKSLPDSILEKNVVFGQVREGRFLGVVQCLGLLFGSEVVGGK